MSENYYYILGVDASATPDQVRTAYRKLALLYHPDKSTKREDHEKFVKIKQAYELISDPFKRRLYDCGLDQMKSDDPSHSWNDFINYMLVAMMSVYKQWKQVKQAEMVIEIEVDVEEIYNKKVKKILVNVKRRADQEVVESKISLLVMLMHYDTEYLFEKMGDEDMLGFKKDILIKLKVKEKRARIDNLFSRFDLFLVQSITLYDYYYSKIINVDYFNDQKLQVEYKQALRVSVVKGEGLPYWDDETDQEKRGDLYVQFDLKLPATIQDSDQVRQLLETEFHTRNLL